MEFVQQIWDIQGRNYRGCHNPQYHLERFKTIRLLFENKYSAIGKRFLKSTMNKIVNFSIMAAIRLQMYLTFSHTVGVRRSLRFKC